MPVKNVSKSEGLTFGNAANNWNSPMDEDNKPVIHHVEHYVNDGDWVARFGILHCQQIHGGTAMSDEATTWPVHRWEVSTYSLELLP